MPQHPAVYEALARDRVAELRRTAQTSPRSRPTGAPGVLGSARKAAGWFLVDLGLRLASPRDMARSA